MRREYVYRAFERFWHWTQAGMIILLGVTGFEIHGTFAFFGYEQAVRLHSTVAIAFLVLISFAIFWHLSSGEWRQYLPTSTHLRAYIDYYVTGIFRGAPHPTKRTVLSKLNPLQKLVYAGLKVLVIPVMVISGLLYMFYRYPQQYGVTALNIDGLSIIAGFHTLGAFALISFFVAHIYLTTTGHTATSNLKAMVTGYEELEGEDTAQSEEEEEAVKELMES
ncbi:MAG: cytochrome b/b6 domain-containing protein [bacterium]|nr:cytochrome b/b6 domain-containing protein [bacterium]